MQQQQVRTRVVNRLDRETVVFLFSFGWRTPYHDDEDEDDKALFTVKHHDLYQHTRVVAHEREDNASALGTIGRTDFRI